MMAELLTRGLPGRHTRFKQTEIGEVPEGWEVVSLESCLSRLIDYRGKSPPKDDRGVPLITAKNVRDGYINSEPREYIVLEKFDSWMSRGVPDPGDVLFTTEAPLGKAAAVPIGKFALGQRLITLCPDRQRIDPIFLLWMLIGPPFQELLLSKATGSTVKGIKQSVLRTLQVLVPPLEEQRAIGKMIQSVADRVWAEEQNRGALVRLKAALMSVLLTGELRVTPDEAAA
jgi:type I restriction enzyme S subunit